MAHDRRDRLPGQRHRRHRQVHRRRAHRVGVDAGRGRALVGRRGERDLPPHRRQTGRQATRRRTSGRLWP
ncbi:hypothetical protein PLANTIT3_40056 [Plantibacter sp. T3]|nr:hypothetical protein PLANTIT3_40056 [Plantibacter sp. T3]